MSYNRPYNLYQDPLKFDAAGHPNDGQNVNVIGTVDGKYLVQSLRTQEQFPTPADHLKYIPHEWKDAAMMYQPQRLMNSFDAPGGVENWESFKPCRQTEHPSYSSCRAFWGNNAFTYMFEASKQHNYDSSRKRWGHIGKQCVLASEQSRVRWRCVEQLSTCCG